MAMTEDYARRAHVRMKSANAGKYIAGRMSFFMRRSWRHARRTPPGPSSATRQQTQHLAAKSYPGAEPREQISNRDGEEVDRRFRGERFLRHV